MRLQRYLINEAVNEPILETGSCCGIYLKNDEYKKLSIVEPIEGVKILDLVIKREKKRDWSMGSILQRCSKDGYYKYDEIVSQAIGMYNFIKSGCPLKKSNLDFIHKSIKKYYDKEKKLFPPESKGKANTTDVVICEGDRKDLLSLKTVEKIDVNNTTGIVTINDFNFIQVSLKASSSGTMRGNLKTYLGNKGISISDKRVDEGIIIKSFIEKISNFLSSIFSKFKKVITKYKNTKIKKFGIKGISEGFINERVELKDPQQIYRSFKRDLNKFISSVDENKMIIKFDGSNLKPNNIREAFFLTCNKISLSLAKDLYNDIVKNHADVLKGMFIDGYFGATGLPLYVVFGGSDGYKYLGTKSDFKGESIKRIRPEMCAVKIKKAKPSVKSPGGEYYVFYFFIIEKMEKNSKVYGVMLSKNKYSLWEQGSTISGSFTPELSAKVIKVPIKESIRDYI